MEGEIEMRISIQERFGKRRRQSFPPLSIACRAQDNNQGRRFQKRYREPLILLHLARFLTVCFVVWVRGMRSAVPPVTKKEILN